MDSLHELLPSLMAVTSGKEAWADVSSRLLPLASSRADKSAWNNEFCSALWVIGTQISVDDESKAIERKLFSDVVKESIQLGLVDGAEVRTALELSTLAMVGLIKDEDGHHRKMIKLNTGVVYKQQKYNLAREETEGYSKLVVLFQSLPRCLSSDAQLLAQSAAASEAIFAVIGQFDLEPNRVLDLLLDFYEEDVANAVFVQIVKHFRRANLLHVLGFKFLHYQDTSSSVPYSLCQLAAVLVSQGLVVLEELLPYLSPSIAESSAALAQSETQLRALLCSSSSATTPLSMPPYLEQLASGAEVLFRTTSASTVVTSSKLLALSLAPPDKPNGVSSASSGAPAAVIASALTPLAAPPTAPTLGASSNRLLQREQQREREKQEREAREAALLAQENQLALQALPLFAPLHPRGSDEQQDAEQRHVSLALAAALCAHDALPDAYRLLFALTQPSTEAGTDRLSWDYLLVVAPRLRRQLCAALTRLLDSEMNSETVRLGSRPSGSEPRPAQSQQRSAAQLLVELHGSFLRVLGYHVCDDAALLRRLCVLLAQTAADSGAEGLSASAETWSVYLGLATQMCLGLCVSGERACFASGGLWRALQPLACRERYLVYDAYAAALSSATAAGSPQLLLLGVHVAEQRGAKEVRRELKRLTRDNAKALALKLAHSWQRHSLSAARAVLAQATGFDNLIPYLVDALKTTSELHKEVVLYSALCLLRDREAERAQTSQNSQTSQTAWFAPLCRFAAVFLAKYPATELRPLLQYLLRSVVQAGRLGDLGGLQALLLYMGQGVSLADLSLAQLEGLSGGRQLRTDVLLSLSPTSSSTSSSASSGLAALSPTARRAMAALREALCGDEAALGWLLVLQTERAKLLALHRPPDSRFGAMAAAQRRDQLLELTVQLCDFLADSGQTGQPGCAAMQSLSQMLGESGLELSAAFQLARPALRSRLQQLPAASNTPSNTPSAAAELFDPESVSAVRRYLDSQLDPESAQSGQGAWWRSERAEASPRLWLYLGFWSFALGDLHHPVERYGGEIKRCKAAYTALDAQKSAASALSLSLSQTEFRKWLRQKEAEMQPCLAAIQTLTEERETHRLWVERVKAWLAAHRDAYVHPDPDTEPTPDPDSGSNPDSGSGSGSGSVCPAAVRDFAQWLQHALFFPRVCVSPLDAVYAAKFLRALWEAEVRDLPLLLVYGRVLATCAALLRHTSEAESGCLGFALREIWATLGVWAESRSKFDKEVRDRSARVCGAWLPRRTSSNTSSEEPSDEEVDEEVLLWRACSSHTSFLHLLRRWQRTSLAHLLALLTLPKGGVQSECLALRCSLRCLSHCVTVWPRHASDGAALLGAVQSVQAAAVACRRDDLATLAKSVAVLLQLQQQQGRWADDAPPGTSSTTASNTTSNTTSAPENTPSNTSSAAKEEGRRDKARSSASRKRPHSAATSANTSSSAPPAKRERGGAEEVRPPPPPHPPKEAPQGGAARERDSRHARDTRDTRPSRTSSFSASDAQPPPPPRRTSSAEGENTPGVRGGADGSRKRDRDSQTSRSQTQTAKPPPPPPHSSSNSGSNSGSGSNNHDTTSSNNNASTASTSNNNNNNSSSSGTASSGRDRERERERGRDSRTSSSAPPPPPQSLPPAPALSLPRERERAADRDRDRDRAGDRERDRDRDYGYYDPRDQRYSHAHHAHPPPPYDHHAHHAYHGGGNGGYPQQPPQSGYSYSQQPPPPQSQHGDRQSMTKRPRRA